MEEWVNDGHLRKTHILSLEAYIRITLFSASRPSHIPRMTPIIIATSTTNVRYFLVF